jgi:hypothetical protein
MKRFQALAVFALATGMAGCSSTQDVLDPSALSPPAPASQTDGTTTTAATPSTAARPAPAATPSPAAPAVAATPRPPSAGRRSVHFAPVVGPNVPAAAALSERLVNAARGSGLRLAGATDPSTTHSLRGYMTALVEGPTVTVIYVWDVYDAAGNRVHRISGQEKAASEGGDGWAAVRPATMQAVADSTIAQFSAWLSTQTG